MACWKAFATLAAGSLAVVCSKIRRRMIAEKSPVSVTACLVPFLSSRLAM